MISYLFAEQLMQKPKLAMEMRTGGIGRIHNRSQRTDVLGERNKRLPLDSLETLYIIVTTREAGYLGSMRLLPSTTNKGQVRSSAHGLDEIEFPQQRIWICAGVRLVSNAPPSVVFSLLAASVRLAIETGSSSVKNLQGEEMKYDETLGLVEDWEGHDGSGPIAPRPVSKGDYRNLLRLADLTELEMEVLICNSDVVQAHN